MVLQDSCSRWSHWPKRVWSAREDFLSASIGGFRLSKTLSTAWRWSIWWEGGRDRGRKKKKSEEGGEKQSSTGEVQRSTAQAPTMPSSPGGIWARLVTMPGYWAVS